MKTDSIAKFIRGFKNYFFFPFFLHYKWLVFTLCIVFTLVPLQGIYHEQTNRVIILYEIRNFRANCYCRMHVGYCFEQIHDR